MDENAIKLALSGLAFVAIIALVVIVSFIRKIHKRTTGFNAQNRAERGEMELKEKTQPSAVRVPDIEMEEVKEDAQSFGGIEDRDDRQSENRSDTVSNYEFLALLGEGSYGRVTLAKRKESGEFFAIKAIEKKNLLKNFARLAALREKEVLTHACDHPFLTALKGFFQTDGHICFVTEYACGGTLSFHLGTGNRFEERKARYYAAELTCGLQFLHKDLVLHRDLTISNILIDAEGHCKIADFGLSKRVSTNLRMTDTFNGSMLYMAPEILENKEYGFTADYWALGVVTFRMLAGYFPFHPLFSNRDDVEKEILDTDVRTKIPSWLSDDARRILEGLLEKDPNNRLGSEKGEVGGVRTHPFFNGLSWEDLRNQRIEPPFRPVLNGPEDTSYFKRHFSLENLQPSPSSSDADIDQTLFKIFDSESVF